MRSKRESGCVHRIQGSLRYSQPAKHSREAGGGSFRRQAAESRNANRDETARPCDANHFLHGLPEEFVMFKNGVAQHGIERIVREARKCIGIGTQDFKIPMTPWPVQIDAQLALRSGKRRQAEQSVVRGDGAHFQHIAPGATSRTDALELLKHSGMHRVAPVDYSAGTGSADREQMDARMFSGLDA